MAAARLGLSAELDAGRHPGAAAAGDRGRPRGRRCRRDEGAVRPQPADPSRRVRPRAAPGVRQRRQPPARARRRTPRSDGTPPGDRCVATPDRDAGARREHPPRRRRRPRRARRGDRHGAPARDTGVRRGELPADRYLSRTARARVRVRAGARDRHRLRRRAGMVRDPHRPHRRASRRRAQHERSLLADAQGAPRRAGDGCRRPRRRLDDAGAQPWQPAESGLRLRGSRACARAR